MTDYTELLARLRDYSHYASNPLHIDSAIAAIEALVFELAEARKPVLLPPGIPTLIPRDERERVISQESFDAGRARGLQENADDEGYARGFVEGRDQQMYDSEIYARAIRHAADAAMGWAQTTVFNNEDISSRLLIGEHIAEAIRALVPDAPP